MERTYAVTGNYFKPFVRVRKAWVQDLIFVNGNFNRNHPVNSSAF